LSFDEAAAVTVPAPVERRFVRADADRLIVVNRSVVATPNHSFRTDRGWLPAERLRTDDVLFGLRDAELGEGQRRAAESVRVGALESRSGFVTTYNLGVARRHNFFAGGMLVHDGP
jgi:intein/homing endonuclease